MHQHFLFSRISRNFVIIGKSLCFYQFQEVNHDISCFIGKKKAAVCVSLTVTILDPNNSVGIPRMLDLSPELE